MRSNGDRIVTSEMRARSDRDIGDADFVMVKVAHHILHGFKFSIVLRNIGKMAGRETNGSEMTG